MGDILITFIKQSLAYRLKSQASKNRIAVKVVQTPKEISHGGCSYAVLAKRENLSRLINLCKNEMIDYRRVLAVYSDMHGNKVYTEI